MCPVSENSSTQDSRSQDRRTNRKIAFLLGTVTFFSFIYFYEGGGWNQNSRFDLLRAIVERHTLQIDAYHENTQDKAHFRGHYYSDKAPGLVFLAVPVALAVRPALQFVGVALDSPRGLFALSYLVSSGTVAFPTALAAVCLFCLGLRFGASAAGSAFGSLVMCLATPLWAYAGLFWAHALVGDCLIFAFAAALQLREEGPDFSWALAVGIAAGWATVTEYPAAPASIMLAGLAFSQAWSRGAAARWRVVAGVGLGAGICVAVLATYLHAAFGSFRPGYAYYDPNSFSFMQQRGYLGLTYPHPDRLLKLLFSCSRGLFFASPVMLAAPFGLRRLWKSKIHRAAALTAAGIFAYYFLFNASFYWWKAGLSFGPRYAGAAIPLLCVGLAVAWQHANRIWRGALVVLALFSIAQALAVISTTSQLSMVDSCPIMHSSWPSFLAGNMATNHDSMLTVAEAGASGSYGAFNLGQIMFGQIMFGQIVGLHGLASLLPLLAAWALAAILFWRIQRKRAISEHGISI
jgi:hypothetical protein